MQKTVPASRRAVPSPGQALSAVSKPLLEDTLERILQTLQRVFPHAELKVGLDSFPVHGPAYYFVEQGEYLQNKVHRKNFNPGSGQASDLAAAVIHSLEKFPIYTLDTPTLFASTLPDETCVQVLMREAQRSAPSIIYVPQIPSWWDTIGTTLRSVFTTLLQNIPRFTPVLFLATSNVQLRDLPEEIKALFNNEYEEVFRIPRPTCAERRRFFEDLVMKQAAQPPALKTKTTCQPLEVLPVAPPPKPRRLTEEEIRQLEEQEEDTLRELRIYLRDVAQRLVIDKRFKVFTKPIVSEEAPNYKDSIKQPMDLLTVLSKIDMHQYLTARDFLKDIDLMCSNALEYKPNKGPADHFLRHKACTLSDTAYSIVRNEMDEGFEQRCQKIKESRKERGTHTRPNSLLCWCKKANPKCKEKWKMPTAPGGTSTSCSNDKLHFIQIFRPWRRFSIFLLQKVLDLVIVATENVSISRMERLYALLSQCIYRHREDDDKTELVKVNFLSCILLCHMLLYMCVCVVYVCGCTVNIMLIWHYSVQLTCLSLKAFISVWKTFIHIAKPLLYVA
uniref:Uncharacterized protein n=1 Tax=Geospiza parvula TaxID=87175 RepID=A0A8U8AUI2_GEOPR